jgi:hypothetical protein
MAAGEVTETLPVDGFLWEGTNLYACSSQGFLIDRSDVCSSFPCPEAGSNAFLSRFLPWTKGALGRLGEFAHQLDIYVPRSHAPRRGRTLLPKS